jgi:hypothetical protein
MSIPRRDLLATVFVGVSLLAYVGWLAGGAFLVIDEVAGVAVVVLALGVAASMSAVVPAFTELLHGSRLYLAAASALGLVALAAGLWALVAGEPMALAGLVLVTILLWAMSTMRHLQLHRSGQRPALR